MKNRFLYAVISIILIFTLSLTSCGMGNVTDDVPNDHESNNNSGNLDSDSKNPNNSNNSDGETPNDPSNSGNSPATSHTVHVDYAYDGKTAEITVPHGETLKFNLGYGLRDGYAFVNWYVGDSVFSLNDPVTSSITVTAKWVKASDGLQYTEHTQSLLGKTFSWYTVSGIGACTDEHLIIPSAYNGKSVTGIDTAAFENCNSITKLTVYPSTTSFSESSFYGCDGLTEIEIPSISIPKKCFAYCRNMEKITFIDSTAESSASINDEAFYACYSLQSFTIPSNVTAVKKWAFYGCRELKSIHIDTVQHWCEMYLHSDSEIKTHAKELYIGGELLTNLVIPEGMTSIPSNAFRGCEHITSVTLPSTLETIGNNAFLNCKSIESVTFGENLKRIGEYAFAGCDNLVSATFTNTERWYIAGTAETWYQYGTPIDVSDPALAAEMLTKSWASYYFLR